VPLAGEQTRRVHDPSSAALGDQQRRRALGSSDRALRPGRSCRSLTIASPIGRGALRTYLGIAPGVGKTYAMLRDGRAQHRAGVDAVVAYWERHPQEHADVALTHYFRFANLSALQELTQLSGLTTRCPMRGAVGAQKAEHRLRLDAQVQAVDGDGLAEGFRQRVRRDCRCHDRISADCLLPGTPSSLVPPSAATVSVAGRLTRGGAKAGNRPSGRPRPVPRQQQGRNLGGHGTPARDDDHA
jgi:hypothetical protein